MAIYVHLVQGVIEYGPGNLPGSWVDQAGDTHCLAAMDDEQRLALEWYEYQEERAPLARHQKYGPPTYATEGPILIASYPAVAMTPAAAAAADAGQWTIVRDERHVRLLESDWIVARAAELGETLSPDWAAYRQALRDVTTQPDPFAIAWPSPPPEPGAQT